jgi:hypothetical protein
MNFKRKKAQDSPSGDSNEIKQDDNVTDIEPTPILDEAMSILQIAKFEKNFNDMYNIAVSATTKFNDIYMVQRKPIPKLFDLVDHHRTTTCTRLRHVFDICQILSYLLKILPAKRVQAQEYLKFEACKKFQDVLKTIEGFAQPLMLKLTTVGDVMSSDIRSKVSRDILRPIEFIPSHIIQEELDELEVELIILQDEYDSFTKVEIDAAHMIEK